MSFITTKLYGQMGNQMFMISAAIATALRHGAEYLIPRESSSRRHWPCYIQHLPQYRGQKIKFLYNEPHDFSFKPISYRPDMMLNGYFQSELHFKDYRKEILRAFNFPYETKEGIVSIHVRRGDYVRLQDKHPPVTLEYIGEAINRLLVMGYDRFLVFSDDIEWCKDNINSKAFFQCDFQYSEGWAAIEDLILMSHCEHNIIANSTFSWWGAWLNQNSNKIVISPSVDNWFGAGNKTITAAHIIPESWQQIKYSPEIKKHEPIRNSN